jgi:hypothetical protein
MQEPTRNRYDYKFHKLSNRKREVMREDIQSDGAESLSAKVFCSRIMGAVSSIEFTCCLLDKGEIQIGKRCCYFLALSGISDIQLLSVFKSNRE